MVSYIVRLHTVSIQYKPLSKSDLGSQGANFEILGFFKIADRVKVKMGQIPHLPLLVLRKSHFSKMKNKASPDFLPLLTLRGVNWKGHHLVVFFFRLYFTQYVIVVLFGSPNYVLLIHGKTDVLRVRI